MSDCSTHAFEYPGMSRLIIRWTDPHERAHNWPFVSNGRKVESVEVDGEVYVPSSKAMKLAHANGELCAQVNELEKRIAELEAGRTCFSDNEPIMLYNDKWHVFRCSECHHQVNLCYNPKPNYCPNCGAKVVDA